MKMMMDAAESIMRCKQLYIVELFFSPFNLKASKSEEFED